MRPDSAEGSHFRGSDLTGSYIDQPLRPPSARDLPGMKESGKRAYNYWAEDQFLRNPTPGLNITNPALRDQAVILDTLGDNPSPDRLQDVLMAVGRMAVDPAVNRTPHFAHDFIRFRDAVLGKMATSSQEGLYLPPTKEDTFLVQALAGKFTPELFGLPPRIPGRDEGRFLANFLDKTELDPANPRKVELAVHVLANAFRQAAANDWNVMEGFNARFMEAGYRNRAEAEKATDAVRFAFYTHVYGGSAVYSESVPKKFIDSVEAQAGKNEDKMRLSNRMINNAMEYFPATRAITELLNYPEVVYDLQIKKPVPGDEPKATDPRDWVETNIIFPLMVDGHADLTVRGRTVRFAERPGVITRGEIIEQAYMAMDFYDGMGFRSFWNRHPVVQVAVRGGGVTYRPAQDQEIADDARILSRPDPDQLARGRVVMVPQSLRKTGAAPAWVGSGFTADPIGSIRYLDQFVEVVKQKYAEVANAVPSEEEVSRLVKEFNGDGFLWMSYGELACRLAYYGGFDSLGGTADSTYNYPVRPPYHVDRVVNPATGGYYRSVTEIIMGTKHLDAIGRGWKKMTKFANLTSELTAILIGQLAKPGEMLFKVDSASCDYARETAQSERSIRQEEITVPRGMRLVLAVCASWGMPVERKEDLVTEMARLSERESLWRKGTPSEHEGYNLVGKLAEVARDARIKAELRGTIKVKRPTLGETASKIAKEFLPGK